MFAVIETGGKQYRVQAGDVLDVELLPIEPRKGHLVITSARRSSSIVSCWSMARAVPASAIR